MNARIIRLRMTVCRLVVALVIALSAVGLPSAWAQPNPQCTWKGQNSSSWGDANNWDCSNGPRIPEPGDDVIIDSGKPFSPAVAGNATIRSLTLNGALLSIGGAATLTVSTSTTSYGGKIVLDGVLTGELDAMLGSPQTGSDSQVGGLGLLSGPVFVRAGGTLQAMPHGTLTINGDLTIDWLGTLLSSGDAIVFNGSTLTNNGTIEGPYLTFKLHGAQQIIGSGILIGGGPLAIDNGSTTTMANAMTWEDVNLTIVHNSLLDIGANTLTLNGVQAHITPGNVITGSGELDFVYSTVANDGVITPMFKVISGTTFAGGLGLFAGPISVTSGTTLTIGSYPNLAAANNVNVDGILNGGNTQMLFSGPTFTNNGLVSPATLLLKGAGEVVQGTGIFSTTNPATVAGGAVVSLGSAVQMNWLAVNPNGRLDLKGHTLTLSHGGIPLANSGVLTTTDSTIVYAGTVTQTLSYPNVNYDHLTISNTTLVNSPPGAYVNVPVAGNFTANGRFAPISSTVTLNGTHSQWIQGQQPVTFTTLIVSNTAGVYLGTNVQVNQHLTLNGDVNTFLSALTMPVSGTTSGAEDVWGQFKRTGPFAPTITYTLGSPYMSATFLPTGTLPSNMTMLLVKLPPLGLGEAPWRVYTFEPDGGSHYTATLRLHYRDSELPANVPEVGLRPWVMDATKQHWMLKKSIGSDMTNDWIGVGSVTDLSVWALAPIHIFLPLIVR